MKKSTIPSGKSASDMIDERIAERVERLRPVQGDEGDAAALLHDQHFIGHLGTSG